MDEVGNLECCWGKLKDHPQCPHGPMLLFKRNSSEGTSKQFFACSACRDRKLCSFYLDCDSKKLNKQQKENWDREKRKKSIRYDHRKLFIRFNEILNENALKRFYCHSCERLFLESERDKHRDHDVTSSLTDHLMTHPTEILKPLENVKKEAQYLFSKKATKDIVDILLKQGTKQILCIGAPRIHEYVLENLDGEVSSLLLDFDGRFHNFFGPLGFCWYNFFNHHFFDDESEAVFKDFLGQNGGRHLALVCDPPFGGRLEPMSQTLKTISELHGKINKITEDSEGLKVLFVFPYFMESLIREKSNPPGIDGGLKALRMSDYKVDYDNHPLFVSNSDTGRKHGSPVRIFTNIGLNALELPVEDGYKYCKRCEKWVSQENKHCKICKDCTSKDGRRYRHCKICERCVKPTWRHCDVCERCVLEKHVCGQKPKVGRCFKCKEFGHAAKDCDTDASKKPKENRKRKKSADIALKKRRKIEQKPKKRKNSSEKKTNQ